MMNDPMQQNPDGSWTPAVPLPFYKDTRPVYIKLWHCFLCLGLFFIWDRKRRENYEDWLELLGDKWMVPEKDIKR